MEPLKRKDQEEDPTNSQAMVLKKVKTNNEIALALDNEKIIGNGSLPRTSNLMAPIMLLTGHGAEVYSVRFSPSGKRIASASFDKTILMWEVYGECKTTNVLKGHINAVLQVNWSADESYVFSASADKTAALWDSETGARIRKFAGHSSIVNTCCPSKTMTPQWVLSGSDDCTTKLWDYRSKNCVETFSQKTPVLSLCFNDIGTQFFVGSVDNDIVGYVMRKKTAFLTLSGHEDSVTGLRLSPDGHYVLSNSMDHSARIWDIRSFVSGSRCQKTFLGHQHTFEKNLLRCAWSPDGNRVSAGSGDRFVYIWEVSSKKILFKLPGHKGSVNEVDFHPLEPIIASCSADRTIYLGELPY